MATRRSSEISVCDSEISVQPPSPSISYTTEATELSTEGGLDFNETKGDEDFYRGFLIKVFGV